MATTSRRAARAIGSNVQADGGPLAELADPWAEVWHDRAAYHDLMVSRGWSMPAAERAGAVASPGNRRRAAADGWARETGLTTDRAMPDCHALRHMGLAYDTADRPSCLSPAFSEQVVQVHHLTRPPEVVQ